MPCDHVPDNAVFSAPMPHGNNYTDNILLFRSENK